MGGTVHVTITGTEASVSQRRALLGVEIEASNSAGKVISAPMDVYLDDFNVVQPDLLVIATDSNARTEERGIVGPPELVVEILSSQSRGRDLVKKAVLYSRFGVPEYWIIDPDRKWILVYALQGDRYEQVESEGRVARSSILPGLEVVPAEMFAGIA